MTSPAKSSIPSSDPKSRLGILPIVSRLRTISSLLKAPLFACAIRSGQTIRQYSQITSSSRLPEAPQTSHDAIFNQLRSTNTLSEARKLHGLLIVHGFLHKYHSPVLGAQLVSSYAGLHSLLDALLVFDHLPKRNAFAWNTILRVLVNVGDFSKAIEFFYSMLTEGLVADNFTYPLVLKACCGLHAIDKGRQIHELIKLNERNHNTTPNIFVQCAVMDMFSKCGSLNEARRVFEDMPMRDLVSWSAMICGTMQSGDWSEALSLFRNMRLEGFKLDSVIIVTIIPACGRLGDLQFGLELQCYAIKSGIIDDLCVSNALIDMYCKCGYTDLAYYLFQAMEHKDVISWSSLIAGYSQNCEYSKSLNLFVEMMGLGISPSPVTLASVLPGFSEWKLLKPGKEIHGYAMRHGFHFDTFVTSALVDLYCHCGLVSGAELIFEIMADKDLAIWNSMITGYALNGEVNSAMMTFRRIQESEFRPNGITIVAVLPLCNRFTMLHHGRELHAYVTRSGLDSVVSVNNSLIDMYSRCGCLQLAKKVFEQMLDRDIVTYNTIIAALGMHGFGDQAITMYKHMNKKRTKPDKVTFIALLSSCSHAGMVEKGLMFYKSMTTDYGIVPDMEHYSCMVDLYGRSGYLDCAWEFISKMPVEPDIDVLGSLLGACRVHKRIDLAELVGKRIFENKLEDPGYYILLSNIYAAVGKWANVTNLRMAIKQRGLMKRPGNSWIHIGCSVHSFLARDRSHPREDKIYEIVENLLLQMRDAGYVPDMNFFLHDLDRVDDESNPFLMEDL